MNDDQEAELPSSPSGRPPIWPLLLIALVLLCAAGVVDETDEDQDDNVNDLAALAIYVAALGVLMSMVLERGALPPPKVEAQQPLCTHCIRPYVEGAHFCPRCSCPVTFFAATASYENIYAQAWILGKAAHHPTRWSHVAGLYMLALAALVTMVALPLAAMNAWRTWLDPYWMWDLLIYGQVLVMAYVFGMLLLICRRNWRIRKRALESLRPASEYGAPPWWTYDRWWTLPEPGKDDDEPHDESNDEEPNGG